MVRIEIQFLRDKEGCFCSQPGLLCETKCERLTYTDVRRVFEAKAYILYAVLLSFRFYSIDKSYYCEVCKEFFKYLSEYEKHNYRSQSSQ